MGGVGIVRVSGANLQPFAALLRPARLPPPRLAARASFVAANGEVIDDGLALRFVAPHSFTGENVLELHSHGGAFVTRALLRRCLQLGARAAEAGEFTLRAYLNNKMDLTQAEAVADLIAAGDVAQARAAARSLAGEFGKQTRALAAQMAEARAGLEGALDFADEDAQTPAASAAAAQIANLRAACERLLEASKRGERLARGASVAIAGAPNVGKSSLFNRLAQSDVAIVTPQAGTTRDVVERDIDFGGVVVGVADTAGLRAARNKAEQAGIARARARMAEADLTLAVGAPGAPPPAEATAADGKTITVFNKTDLSGEAAGERDGAVYVSAKTGDGLPALRAAIARALEQKTTDAPFLARARHVAALQEAAALLKKAEADSAQPELAAAWLQDAQALVAAIHGNNGMAEEELLADIFSRFCVGK